MHRSNKLWMLQTGIRCDKIEVLKIKAILLTLRKSIRTIAPPPRLGMGFGSRLGLVLGLGGNQTKLPPRKVPRVWLGFRLALVLRLGRAIAPD